MTIIPNVCRPNALPLQIFADATTIVLTQLLIIMQTLPVNLDNETLKQIDALSQKQNLSPSQIAKLAIEFCSLLPPNVWLTSNVVSGADSSEMANILARALLDSQYHEAIEKIKPQLDKDWLDSLVTEDDILDAAIKLTEDD